MVNNIDGLAELRTKAAQMEKDLKKTLGFQMNKLSDIMKQAGVVKEKKAKLLKKPCTMQLMSDDTIRILFDNIEDGKKMFA